MTDLRAALLTELDERIAGCRAVESYGLPLYEWLRGEVEKHHATRSVLWNPPPGRWVCAQDQHALLAENDACLFVAGLAAALGVRIVDAERVNLANRVIADALAEPWCAEHGAFGCSEHDARHEPQAVAAAALDDAERAEGAYTAYEPRGDRQ